MPELPSPASAGSCPTWCVTQHQRALDEGATDSEAALRASGSVAQRLDEIRNAATGNTLRAGFNVSWELQLTADPAPFLWGVPAVLLQVDSFTDEEGYKGLELDLTTGEARVLARHLQHFADTADLEGLR